MQQTDQPYAYAGDDPVDDVDPGGQDWLTTEIANHGGHQVGSFFSGVANGGAQAFRSTVNFGLEYFNGGGPVETAPSLNVPNPYPCNTIAYAAGEITGGITVGAAGILINPDAGAIEATADIAELLSPGGELIGEAGSSSAIRIVQGGQAEAERLFAELTAGGTDITPVGHIGQLVELPDDAGYIGYRSFSRSGPPTIDVNVPGSPIREIKFVS